MYCVGRSCRAQTLLLQTWLSQALLLLTLLSSLAGCSGSGKQYIPLKPDAVSKIQKAAIVSIVDNSMYVPYGHYGIEKKEAPLNTRDAKLGVGLPAPLEPVIAEKKNSTLTQLHPGLVDPQLSFTKDVTLLKPLAVLTSEVLREIDWLDVNKVTTLEIVRQNTDIGDVLFGQAHDSALVLATRYFFSISYRRVFVHTDVSLYNKRNAGKPVFHTTVRYHSNAVGERQDNQKSILKHWSRNDAEKLKMELQRGIEKNLQIIIKAINNSDYVHNSNQFGGEHVIYNDEFGKRLEIPGKILARDEDAYQLKSVQGGYYTINNPNLRDEAINEIVSRSYRPDLFAGSAGPAN